MATQTTQLLQSNGNLAYRVFPYQGLSDGIRDHTQVPRSELTIVANAVEIAAGGAGNNQRLFMGGYLPLNFSYVLRDLNVMIQGQTAGATNNFEDIIGMYIRQQNQQGADDYFQFMELCSSGQTSRNADADKAKVYTLRDGIYPNQVIFPRSSIDGLVFEVSNLTDNDQAYHVWVYARFLTYDVSQANHWQVNTPTPTR